MYPSFHTWITSRPTPQKRPTPTTAKRTPRPEPKRGRTTFGQHRQQFGALPRRSVSEWGATGGSGYDMLTAYQYPRTPGEVLAAAAKRKGMIQ